MTKTKEADNTPCMHTPSDLMPHRGGRAPSLLNVSPQEGVVTVLQLHVLLGVDDVGMVERQLLQGRLRVSTECSVLVAFYQNNLSKPVLHSRLKSEEKRGMSQNFSSQ